MSFSIDSALRTCKVDTGWANRIQSDRFENPNNLVCPTWGGTDLAGRYVCPDSFMTKSAGCNSAEDRVIVENMVARPQYMEYITLNASGIQGDIYGGPEEYQYTSPYQASINATNELNRTHDYTGSFNNNFRANIAPQALQDGHPTALMLGQDQMAAQAQANRMGQRSNEGFISNQKRSCSGF